jgi:hypothetical protein
MPKIDEHDKRELELYVENTAELYPDKKEIIAPAGPSDQHRPLRA